MADTKITALAAITTVDPAADVLPIVDVSDTSMAASGTTKKITSNQILGAGGTATLASATITGDLTVDTSTLKVDSANNRVGIGTATPADTLDVNGRVTALRYLSSSSNASLPSFAVSAGNGAYNSGTNEIGFSINSTSAMTLNASGLGVGVVPSAGKGALQLSSGINFPATQVASSDANTLDDYEEGTWTPTIGASSGTPTTVTVNSANYTKVGRVVVVNFDFSIVNKGTASSALQFSLPFNHAGSSIPCGAFRENSATGKMGQVLYNSSSNAGCFLYDNATVWVDGYRIQGTYTYFTA